ncbi:MAG TPA: hypothetical protein VKU02_08325 [Gemmataceae bacterium]|nr:hypothetical protein [Gemmataceae bacterium]
MRRRTAAIDLNVWSPARIRYLRARRVAWLAAVLVAASLAEGSLAGVAGRIIASRGRDQIFRVRRLAPTRAG